MRPITNKEEPRKSPAMWIALVAIVTAIAAAILWFTRMPDKPAPTAKRATPAAHTGYRNRAVLKRPSSTDQPAAMPAIRGNVYNADGEVLSGALVVAATFDRAGNVPSPAGSVRTDASGRFELPLAEGTYQLNASNDGYGVTSITAQSGDTVSMVLHKSGVLQGHVRDERGKPIRRFTIDVVSVVPGDAPAPPPVWSKTFTSDDGSFRADQIPAWPIMLRATADDRAPGFSPPLAVHAGDTRDVDLTLGAGCTLTGAVVDKQGAPLPGVLVNAEERVTAGSANDPTLQTSTQAQSGDDGSFQLEHVPQGTVLVRGYDGDFAVTTATIEITDCSKLPPVRLTMSAGGSITGVARRADGTPLVGARLGLNERSIGFVNTTTDAAGRFRFDALPAGGVRIELESDGQRAMRFVAVKDGETVTQDMTLFAGGNGELRGTVTAGKKPIAGARLLVAANHGQQQGIAMYFPITGADGTFRVPSIPEGNYLVSVMSTTEGRGVKVNAGEVATMDLDAGFLMPMAETAPRPATARRTPPPAAPAPADAPTPSP